MRAEAEEERGESYRSLAACPREDGARHQQETEENGATDDPMATQPAYQKEEFHQASNATTALRQSQTQTYSTQQWISNAVLSRLVKIQLNLIGISNGHTDHCPQNEPFEVWGAL